MTRVIIVFKPESIEHALQVMKSNQVNLERISGVARERGARHHTFYADREHGTLVAVDEWPSAEVFHGFFADNTAIADILEQAGVREDPEIMILDDVETPGTF